jgi:endoplasmic reticulum-Golgi intermediate compartment protein 3
VGKLEHHRTSCCNTCLELKRAYIAHGLNPDIASNSEQCLREHSLPKLVAPQEGCRIHGHLEVQPSQGNFHVAAGKSVQASHMSHLHHIHQMSLEELATFDISHKITFLSFGRPLSRFSYPLTNVSYTDLKLSQVKYFIRVVPVNTAESSDGQTQKTFLYSANQFVQPVEITSGHFPVPGVFFFYDFSELQISSMAYSPSLIQVITRICAVVGGMFVILGFIYQGLDFLFTKIFGLEKEGITSLL